MDDLDRIKALEAQLAVELDEAAAEARSIVEAASASKKEVVGSAVLEAEARARGVVAEAEARARREAADIRAGYLADLKALEAKSMVNFERAVLYVLGELGV